MSDEDPREARTPVDPLTRAKYYSERSQAPVTSKKIAHELFDACNAFKEDSKQWQRIAVAIQAAADEIERLTRERDERYTALQWSELRGTATGLQAERDRLRAAVKEFVRLRKVAVESAVIPSTWWNDSERAYAEARCLLNGDGRSDETSERSLPELLRRLDALTDLPVGVTAIADETIFRDAAAEIRSLERRLEAANARIQRWQIPECADSGWEMRDGQMVCKGCNRSFSDILNSAEARCRRRSPEKASELPSTNEKEGKV